MVWDRVRFSVTFGLGDRANSSPTFGSDLEVINVLCLAVSHWPVYGHNAMGQNATDIMLPVP